MIWKVFLEYKTLVRASSSIQKVNSFPFVPKMVPELSKVSRTQSRTRKIFIGNGPFLY